jgi:hypothetical protein
MLNRLRWIAVSYLTSRLVQGLLLAAVVTYGLSLWQERQRDAYQPNHSFFQLSWTDLKTAPKSLVAAQVEIALGPDQDLSQLRGLKFLRRLDVSTVGPQPERIDYLTDVPNLRAVVWHTQVDDDQSLRAFAKLPHLETLVVDDQSPMSLPTKFTRSGFAALANAPALKTLYVGSWHDRGDHKLEELARAALPGITVLPEYEFNSALLFLCGPFLLSALAIAIQLVRQSSNPFRALAPGYISGHVIFALGLILLITALAAANLSRIFGGAFVAITFSVGIVSAGVAIASGSNPAIWKMLVSCGRVGQ